MPSMIGSLHWVSRKLVQMASLRNQDLGFKGQGPPAQCPDGACVTWDAVGAAHIVSVCREFTGFVDTIAAGALAECGKVVMISLAHRLLEQ